jgi:CheY-like chemotaxis protein
MPNTRQILIVDDDPELRHALTEQLSLLEEFEAVAAEDGSKGLQAAKAGTSACPTSMAAKPCASCARTASRRRSSCSRAMAPTRTPSSASIRAPTITSPSPSALPCCWRASAPSFAARDERGRGLHDRPARVSARLEAAAQSQGQQGPLDREGELDPALPLPRRPAAGIAGDAVARGAGLQLGSHHAHA